MATWTDLQLMRSQGIKPALPVVITLGEWHLDRNLREVGCLTIKHTAGQPMPAKLLQGLTVWLFVGPCQRINPVARILRTHDVTPAKLLTWCHCTKSLTHCGADCSTNYDWR